MQAALASRLEISIEHFLATPELTHTHTLDGAVVVQPSPNKYVKNVDVSR